MGGAAKHREWIGLRRESGHVILVHRRLGRLQRAPDAAPPPSILVDVFGIDPDFTDELGDGRVSELWAGGENLFKRTNSERTFVQTQIAPVFLVTPKLLGQLGPFGESAIGLCGTPRRHFNDQWMIYPSVARDERL